MDILKGIRPLDYALTAIMTFLAGLLAVMNVVATSDADFAHPLDSHSTLMAPVFVLAALPILWRRRSVLGAIGVSFAVLATSVPMFGWVTRCGFALPLSVAMAYAVARFAGSRQNQLLGLVAILALQVVTLVKDASTGGLGALTLAVPAAAVAYGLGWFVQSRSAKRVPAATLGAEHVHA